VAPPVLLPPHAPHDGVIQTWRQRRRRRRTQRCKEAARERFIFFSEAEGGARGGEASGFSFSEAERGARGGERRCTNNSCIIGVEKYRQTILGGCPYAFLRVSSDVCEVLFSKPTKL